MIGPLPESQGYDAVLTIIEKFSKHPVFIPTTTTLTSEGWAQLLVDHVSKRFRLLWYIISDWGPIFVSKFIKEWYQILGIKGHPTMAYHPRADGQSERMNQEIKIYLQHFITHRQDNWPDWMSIAEFSIANQKSSTTRYSPFFITQGQHPWTSNPLQTTVTTNNESITDLVKRMATIHQAIKDALENAQAIMKRQYNKHHKSVTYEKGDKVWLDIWNFTSEQPLRKLDYPRYGPIVILEKCGTLSYWLQLLKTWKIFSIFNEALLTPFTSPSFPSQELTHEWPPPEIINDNKQYEIEEIINSQKWHRKLYYLVKWLRYPHDENTWIPVTETKNCQELIHNFHKSHPNALKWCNHFPFIKTRHNTPFTWPLIFIPYGYPSQMTTFHDSHGNWPPPFDYIDHNFHFHLKKLTHHHPWHSSFTARSFRQCLATSSQQIAMTFIMPMTVFPPSLPHLFSIPLPPTQHSGVMYDIMPWMQHKSIFKTYITLPSTM